MRTILTAVGRALRETGQALDRTGSSLMGNYAFKEQLSRHRRIMPLGDAAPNVAADAFVAPNSSVIGKVTVGERSSIWYGAVLRADLGEIHVGAGSAVGDRCVVQTSKQQPVKIGSKVSIGAGAVLDGAITLGDECIVGERAVLTGPVVVEEHAVIAPGAVVEPGTTVTAASLWSGAPARLERHLDRDEIASIATLAQNNADLAQKHHLEHSKTEGQRQKERDFKEFHKDASVYKETPF